MKTLKQHLYDNCRGQTLYIDEMINLTKEWLQEHQDKIPNIGRFNFGKIQLLNELIEELEQ